MRHLRHVTHLKRASRARNWRVYAVPPKTIKGGFAMKPLLPLRSPVTSVTPTLWASGGFGDNNQRKARPYLFGYLSLTMRLRPQESALSASPLSVQRHARVSHPLGLSVQLGRIRVRLRSMLLG